MHHVNIGGRRQGICKETAPFLLFETGSHQVCCGFIWAEMREQQEGKANRQREREGKCRKQAFSDLSHRGNQYAGWEAF